MKNKVIFALCSSLLLGFAHELSASRRVITFDHLLEHPLPLREASVIAPRTQSISSIKNLIRRKSSATSEAVPHSESRSLDAATPTRRSSILTKTATAPSFAKTKNQTAIATGFIQSGSELLTPEIVKTIPVKTLFGPPEELRRTVEKIITVNNLEKKTGTTNNFGKKTNIDDLTDLLKSGLFNKEIVEIPPGLEEGQVYLDAARLVAQHRGATAETIAEQDAKYTQFQQEFLAADDVNGKREILHIYGARLFDELTPARAQRQAFNPTTITSTTSSNLGLHPRAMTETSPSPLRRSNSASGPTELQPKIRRSTSYGSSLGELTAPHRFNTGSQDSGSRSSWLQPAAFSNLDTNQQSLRLSAGSHTEVSPIVSRPTSTTSLQGPIQVSESTTHHSPVDLALQAAAINKNSLENHLTGIDEALKKTILATPVTRNGTIYLADANQEFGQHIKYISQDSAQKAIWVNRSDAAQNYLALRFGNRK